MISWLLLTLAVDPAAAAVARLGAEDLEVRCEAQNELEALGPEALPALRAALQDADPERRGRAADTIDRIRRSSLAIRRLQTLDPVQAADLLKGVFPAPALEVEADLRTRSLILRAKPAVLAEVETLLACSDDAPEGISSFVVRGCGSAEALAEMLQRLLKAQP